MRTLCGIPTEADETGHHQVIYPDSSIAAHALRMARLRRLDLAMRNATGRRLRIIRAAIIIGRLTDRL